MSEIPTVRLINRADPGDAIVVNLEDEALYADRYCRHEQLASDRAAIADGPSESPIDAAVPAPSESPELPEPAPARPRRNRPNREI